MGFLQRLASAWTGFKSGGSVVSSLDLFREVFGGASREATAGRTVTTSTALEVATVFACLRVIAEGVAQSPCDLFRDRAAGGKDKATDHPLYSLFALAPNDLQTPFEFFETLVFHAGLTGNFVAFKNVVRGRVAELIPFEPGTWEMKRALDRSVAYRLQMAPGRWVDVPADAIWHVRGPSWNAAGGMDLLRVAREAVGLSMAIERDQALLYKNGLRTSGTYAIEGTLSGPEYDALRAHIKAWQAEQGGPLVLDRAAKYMSETMTGVDAQTLESRKLQVEEICRVFRVMPLMVGHAGNTSPTFASAEQFFIAHVVHTLLPWCRRIESSINKNLIGERDFRAGVKAKFNLNALMRGSFADRQKAFAQMLGLGGAAAYAEINEVRELDDMNPVEWGTGKPEPSNAPAKTDPTPADQTPADPASDPAPTNA